jgi:hypothetical protein
LKEKFKDIDDVQVEGKGRRKEMPKGEKTSHH